MRRLKDWLRRNYEDIFLGYDEYVHPVTGIPARELRSGCPYECVHCLNGYPEHCENAVKECIPRREYLGRQANG